MGQADLDIVTFIMKIVNWYIFLAVSHEPRQIMYVIYYLISKIEILSIWV